MVFTWFFGHLWVSGMAKKTDIFNTQKSRL